VIPLAAAWQLAHPSSFILHPSSLPLAAAWQFTLLGLPARLERPEGLLFLAGVLVAAVLLLRAIVKRSRALLGRVPERLLPRMAPGAGTGRDLWSAGSLVAGLALLSVAAAQPQCGTRTELARRYGIDLVIALDASNSMLARDVRPSRIDRAKLELASLLDRLKGDRVGIVVFAGDAFVQCPLTTDYSAAKLFLRAVNPDALPQQGTALAAALKTSRDLFRAGGRGAAGRALVLITDGEDHEGDVDAALKDLNEDGVRVFAVGVGSASGEPIPVPGPDGSVTGYRKDSHGRTIMTRLDEAVLRKLAEATGGRYVHSASGDLGVGEVYEELDRMDKSEFESRLTVQYDNRYAAFAWPGFALACAGLAFGEGRFRRRAEAGR